MEDLSAFSARPRLAALLDHFAKVEDTRQAWKVMYPLREVLFLVVCGTIASGDDNHSGSAAGGIRFAVKPKTALTSPRRPGALDGST